MNIGLPESNDPYYSTSQAAKMLGVSLGTVQNMVEEGVLDAWKTSGGHRRIKREAVMELLAKRGDARADPGDGGLTLLIVEADTALQQNLRETMNGWALPLAIEIVDNGFDALLLIGRRAPDVILLDIQIQGMDGFELVRALHANPSLAGTDILVLSGLAREEITRRGSLPPDVPIYCKPIPFHELHGFFRAKITQNLRQSRPR